MPSSSTTRFLLLDGGMGHLLKRQGNATSFLGGALASEPATIKEAHRKFIEAGAADLTTATFGVTPVSLKRAGIPDSELEGITRRVARLAVEVAAEENAKRQEEAGGGKGGKGKRVLVAGCLPPLGQNCYLPRCCSPSSERSINEAAAVYERIAGALLEAGVDLFLAEACSGSGDAEAAVRGATRAAANSSRSPSPASRSFPLWLSFTVDDEQPLRLRGGEELEAAARRALSQKEKGRLPVSALLLNCSSPGAVSKALPVLLKVISEQQEGEEIGIGCYANGFRRTTTSWLRAEGVALPPPTPSSPSNAAAAEEEEEEADYGYDGEEGMITPGCYARYARRWVRSFRCGSGSGGGSGSCGGSGSGGGSKTEKSCRSSPPRPPSFFVLGGCCGVGPEHIRALRDLLDAED